MKPLAIVLGSLIFIGSVHGVPRNAERVWIRSVKGQKEVLICSLQKQKNEDRVVVRFRYRGREVLALPSFQTPYGSQASAAAAVRVHWRPDGKAVVVNLLVNGGSQEAAPLYVVWKGASATSTAYEPVWRRGEGAGESSTHFVKWDSSGKPVLEVR